MFLLDNVVVGVPYRSLQKLLSDGSCSDGYGNRIQMLFSLKKRTRLLKLLSSEKLNGAAQLLKVMAVVTALVYQLF